MTKPVFPLIQQFLNELADSPNTQSTYATGLEKFLLFLQNVKLERGATLSDLTNSIVKEFDTWLADRHAAALTRRTWSAAVFSWFKYLSEQDLLPATIDITKAHILWKARKKRTGYKIPDPTMLAETPKLVAQFRHAPAPPDPDNQKEVTRYLVYLRNRALVWLLYTTGVRISEACGLKRSALRGKDGFPSQIKVFGKGSKYRMVVFNDEQARRAMFDYLSARTDTSEYVFINHEKNNGAALDRKHAWRIIKSAARAVGADLSPHSLRHHYASFMVNEGAPMEIIQKALGHSSISTTAMIYATLDMNTIEQWVKNIPMPSPK